MCAYAYVRVCGGGGRLTAVCVDLEVVYLEYEDFVHLVCYLMDCDINTCMVAWMIAALIERNNGFMCENICS